MLHFFFFEGFPYCKASKNTIHIDRFNTDIHEQYEEQARSWSLGSLCGRLTRDWARRPSQTSRGTSTSATWTGTPWRTGPSSQSLCLPSKTLKWASFVNLYNFQLCWNLYLIIFMHTGHRLLWQGVHRQGPEQSQRWQRHRGLTGLWEVLWRGLRGIQFLQHKLRALIASFSEW